MKKGQLIVDIIQSFTKGEQLFLYSGVVFVLEIKEFREIFVFRFITQSYRLLEKSKPAFLETIISMNFLVPLGFFKFDHKIHLETFSSTLVDRVQFVTKTGEIHYKLMPKNFLQKL